MWVYMDREASGKIFTQIFTAVYSSHIWEVGFQGVFKLFSVYSPELFEYFV